MLSFHTISGAPISGTPRRFALVAEVGEFTLIGQDATLTTGGAVETPRPTLFVGGPAPQERKRRPLRLMHVLRAETGRFVLDGQDAVLFVRMPTPPAVIAPTAPEADAAYQAFRRKLAIERDDLEVMMEL